MSLQRLARIENDLAGDSLKRIQNPVSCIFIDKTHHVTNFCQIPSIGEGEILSVLTVVNRKEQIVSLSKHSTHSNLFYSVSNLCNLPHPLFLQYVSNWVCYSFELPDTNENVQCPTPVWHDSGANGPQLSNSSAMQCKACPTLWSMWFSFLNFLLLNNVSVLDCRSAHKEHIVPVCPPSAHTHTLYDIVKLWIAYLVFIPSSVIEQGLHSSHSYFPIYFKRWLYVHMMLISSGTTLIDTSLSALRCGYKTQTTMTSQSLNDSQDVGSKRNVSEYEAKRC